VSGDEVVGPAVVFEQALKAIPERTPPQTPTRVADAATVAAADPASAGAALAVLERNASADDPPVKAAEPALLGAVAESPAAEVRGVSRLAELAWGAALGSIGSIVMIVVKRHRFAGGSGQLRPWFSRRAGGRKLPARLPRFHRHGHAATAAAPKGVGS
jgi:hypothetical protein